MQEKWLIPGAFLVWIAAKSIIATSPLTKPCNPLRGRLSRTTSNVETLTASPTAAPSHIRTSSASILRPLEVTTPPSYVSVIFIPVWIGTPTSSKVDANRPMRPDQPSPTTHKRPLSNACLLSGISCPHPEISRIAFSLIGSFPSFKFSISFGLFIG